MAKMKPKSRTPDRARQKTDKMLGSIERQMGRVYDTDPALLKVEKKYNEYMEYVQKRTEDAYRAFIDADDEETKEKAKKAYMGQIRRYTIESKEYNSIIKQFVRTMADVNQKALDIINDAMPEIYVVNYNQVAEDCRKVGIKVNDGSGEKRKE